MRVCGFSHLSTPVAAHAEARKGHSLSFSVTLHFYCLQTAHQLDWLARKLSGSAYL